jgi:hypothetical protein
VLVSRHRMGPRAERGGRMNADEARRLTLASATTAEERKRIDRERERAEVFSRIRAACERGESYCWITGGELSWLTRDGYQVRCDAGVKYRWRVQW